jgi:hypothetical protein
MKILAMPLDTSCPWAMTTVANARIRMRLELLHCVFGANVRHCAECYSSEMRQVPLAFL